MNLRRLRRLGLAELADRSRQKATQWVDRVVPVVGANHRSRAGLATRAGAAADAAAIVELFRDAAPARFFPGAERGDAADVLREHLPAAHRDVVAAANAVCARRFDLLGYEGLSFGEQIDWHFDPVAGRGSPLRHWSRLDLGAPDSGDPKVIWELNRHQWLLPLAQAYWLTADRRYAQEAADLVDDWTRANPYGMGLNWASSLEVAYRLISWTWSFVLTRDAAVLSPREFSGLLGQIRQHALHIERYLSRYFSPNTHLTGEALGLFYAGVLFPELREAARWRRLGRQILIEESRKQVLDDGVYFEQAVGYQLYTIDIYLHFLILAERNEITVPADVRRRTEKMVEFLLAISAPDGTVPQIGDADGGTLLPLSRRTAGDARGTFSVAAAIFGRSDFLWAAGGATPEAVWLLGTEGWKRLERLGIAAPVAPVSTAFREGGYVVMRSEWSRNAHWMILDTGPLGCEISAAHGHADLLSLQCAAFGEPYIVDPGTFCYGISPEWRDHFRGTHAHSTVVIDELPQAEPKGPFAWRSRPAASLRAWQSNAEFDLADASHSAYETLPDPVTHRRRVLFVKPHYWIVVDDLLGQDEHRLQLRFQFAPRPVRLGPEAWVVAEGRRGEGIWLSPFSAAPIQVSLLSGETSPPNGWISSQYGKRQAAPMAVFAWCTRLPVRIVTAILPVNAIAAGPPAVEPLYENGIATGLRLIQRGELVRVSDEAVWVEKTA